MIAKKREVAATMWQVFRGANVKLGNWRQVTVRIKTDYCLPTGKRYETTCEFLTTHTGECTVTACRTDGIVRKGGDFFYGKSSNENHIEGV